MRRSTALLPISMGIKPSWNAWIYILGLWATLLAATTRFASSFISIAFHLQQGLVPSQDRPRYGRRDCFYAHKPRVSHATQITNHKSNRPIVTNNTRRKINDKNDMPLIHVAIIGGGVAGLSCAQTLVQQSQRCDVTVFDTGRLRPGGRCSSRWIDDPIKSSSSYESLHLCEKGVTNQREYPILSKFLCDHAAQLLIVPENDSRFRPFARQVQLWEQQHVIKRFDPETIFIYNARTGKWLPLPTPAYHGSKGMASIPMAMVDSNRNLFQIQQDVWVSPSNGVRWMDSLQQWKVQASGKVLGYFDQLIVAHNGKCADRLLSKTPARDVHALMRVNFAPSVSAKGGSRMTLNSMYSLTVALTKSASQLIENVVPTNLIAGMIQNHDTISFVTCQTRKYPPTISLNDREGIQVWTILSTPAFAKKYKAPQEFLSDETIQIVSQQLLRDLAGLLKIDLDAFGMPDITDLILDPSRTSNERSAVHSSVLDFRLQLWGAALPLNIWHTNSTNTSQQGYIAPAGFLYDPIVSLGVCGDWLLDPSLAGAWTSGHELALYLAQNCLDETNCGLRKLNVKNDTVPIVGAKGGLFRRSESARKAGIGAIM